MQQQLAIQQTIRLERSSFYQSSVPRPLPDFISLLHVHVSKEKNSRFLSQLDKWPENEASFFFISQH